jgi:hypothetical protein
LVEIVNPRKTNSLSRSRPLAPGGKAFDNSSSPQSWGGFTSGTHPCKPKEIKMIATRRADLDPSVLVLRMLGGLSGAA